MTVLVLTNVNLILYYICIGGTACLLVFFLAILEAVLLTIFSMLFYMENKEMLKGQNSLTDVDI